MASKEISSFGIYFMANNLPTLSQLPKAFKALCTAFILSILLGYGVALLKIYDLSSFSVQHTLSYYRGDASSEVSFPQSYASLLSVAHVHTFSQPILFFLMGFIFCFSSISEKTKKTIIWISFSSLLMSNLSPWLVRYTHPATILFFPLSQGILVLCLMLMSFVSLKELVKK